MMLKLRLRKFKDRKKTSKTHEKHQIPLATKITNLNAIYICKKYFQKLSKALRMKYVNITLDIGAAMNAFKFFMGRFRTVF